MLPRLGAAVALAASAIALTVHGIGPAPAVDEFAEPGVTTRASVASGGAQWAAPSAGSAAGGEGPALSADGRHVAFVSSGTNAGAGAPGQVFVRDRTSGTTTLVSRTPAGDAGNGRAFGQPAVSADGRYVAFQSDASDLVGPRLVSRSTLAPDLIAASIDSAGTGTVKLTFDEPAWDTCPAALSCAVTVGPSTARTATFAPSTIELEVRTSGKGRVVSTPEGIDCTDRCIASFGAGSAVTLTPQPGADQVFAGWSGACEGTDPCTVAMSEARSVSAAFRSGQSSRLTVDVGTRPSGTETVVSAPAGITCPPLCASNFSRDATVTLRAVNADPEAVDIHWPACKPGPVCAVKPAATPTVTVGFGTRHLDAAPVLALAAQVASTPAAEQGTATLDVGLAGAGQGSVSSTPAAIACPPRCSATLPAGTAVTLEAKPAAGSTFAGWSGYRMVVLGGARGDRLLPCTPVSGDGTTEHVVSCRGLDNGTPGRMEIEPGTVATRPEGKGVANPLQAAELPGPPQTDLSPNLVSASLDLGGTDSRGARADVVAFAFGEPVAVRDARSFAAYRADGSTVAAIEAVGDGGDCCSIRAAFPDGSLRTAVGASVRTRAVEETTATGVSRQPNLPDEVGLDNVAGDGNGATDVFVADRDADGNGVFDEPGPAAFRMTKVSVGAAGMPADGASTNPSISADGRYVAFQSTAGNLIPQGFGEVPLQPGALVNDSNRLTDVFVHDRDADGNGLFDEGGSAERTIRASVADDGSQTTSLPPEPGNSYQPALSATGRYVAFASRAPNLIEGAPGPADTNEAADVFVRDRDADGNGVFDEPAPGRTSTRRVSLGPGGSELGPSEAPAISADGRIVAFAAQLDPGRLEVLVRDRDADGNGVDDEPGAGAATTALASVGASGAPGSADSRQPAISADGRYVSFFSQATDLVPPRPRVPRGDIFVRDRLRARTTVVSTAPGGAPGDRPSDSASSLSGDGRSVAFSSLAGNLVAGDSNGVQDAFVRDRRPLASVDPDRAGFGSVELGSRSGPTGVQLENLGAGPLAVGTVSVAGPAAADFTIEAQDCTGRSLRSLPGERCTVTVSFTPGSPGRRDALLVVEHDPAPDGRTEVPLTGIGVVPPVSVNPASLDFGAIGVGLSSDRTADVVNLGRSPQALGSLSVGGPAASDFSVVAGGCPPTLPPGASCALRVRFAPALAGDRAASLSGLLGLQSFSVDLVGAGVPGLLQLRPDPLDFGTVDPGGTADRSVTVANGGAGLLRLDRFELAGADYSLVTDGCTGGTLGPAATCGLTLRLAPTSPGARPGTLTAHAAVAGAAPSTAAVRLAGAGGAQASTATIEPHPLEFGDQDVAVPVKRTVTVAGAGSEPLVLGPLTLTGASPGDFAVATDHCSGVTLPAGASCTVEIAFSPTAAGRRTAIAVLPGAGSLDLGGNGLLYTPVVTLSVTVGPPGTVTMAEGTGFRPNAGVGLRWVPADRRPDAPAPLGAPVAVHVDAGGHFGPVPISIIQKDVLGPRTLEARGRLPGTAADAAFLVVAGTARPAGADVFVNRQTTLVNRG